MPDHLTFGYLYDFRNPVPFRRPWTDVYAETLDMVAWTESLGFGGAWVAEHHCAEDGYLPSPLVALGAMAARTSRIIIGTAVALAPLYHPVRFAEDCAVLDILARGRLEMALAIGYRRRETEAYGVDFTKRGSRFDEFLQIVQPLWAGETVSFEGKHFSVSNARIVPSALNQRIPLFIGGFADKAMERIAKYADGYFGNEDSCAPYLRKLEAQGKDPASGRIRLTELFLTVAHDPDRAMDELAPYYHYVNNSYGEWANEDKAVGVEDGLKPMSLDEFKASGTLKILTPEAAIAKFRSLRERMPVEHIMMMMPAGMPVEIFRRQAQLFADEVLPAFA
ncbi:MAG TPA: LLM class flavin-dependent oxidoreductase [Sphingobium sp.]|uniref:LLM class flavin-dependent oxidoreductase n=1 Tax=Sphingobium sp. TaxID=1912891 RepID=UPI002ED49C0A